MPKAFCTEPAAMLSFSWSCTEKLSSMTKNAMSRLIRSAKEMTQAPP